MAPRGDPALPQGSLPIPAPMPMVQQTEKKLSLGWYIFTALGPDVERVRRLRSDVIPLLETV